MKRRGTAITLPQATVSDYQGDRRQRGKALQIYHEYNCLEKPRETPGIIFLSL